ncbi:hypothetical protein [Peribacillus loiseleuriae]|uniref:Uncharacterized protein n=1 Tax=Peribacillus loiseleuriae TaxID=1679170 RepID=A0A0K9GRG0_9BACI|nr:hypothetical protein [Peribacillus loiseleuriae]KMY49218.1 hypothetical protein AC625_06515 [Peribacillus loiseleuriae]
MNDPGVFAAPCAICRVRKATRWCDYIIKYDHSIIFIRDYKRFVEENSYPHNETCDLPLCEECTHDQNKADLCPHHHKLQQQAELPENLRGAQARTKMKIAQEILNR